MSPAPYSALDIARWILASIDRDAGDSITHLKLQKLVYYAQAWSLALNERPLFNEDLRAWAHGPVAESVFDAYRGFGWEAIPAPDSAPQLSEDDEALLRRVLDGYGDFSAKHLETMTHGEDPWKTARGDLPLEARSSAIIPKPHMARYYRALYRNAADGET